MTLEGWVPQINDYMSLQEVVEFAFDYRGNTTIVKTDGTEEDLRGADAGALEARERLEQLRALERGLVIQVAEAAERPGPDVNTPADLERVSALMSSAPG